VVQCEGAQVARMVHMHREWLVQGNWQPFVGASDGQRARCVHLLFGTDISSLFSREAA